MYRDAMSRSFLARLDPVSPLPGGSEALATLLSNLPGAAYECSLNAPWEVFYVSQGIEALTGYSAKTFTEDKLVWGKITHPDDLPGLERIVDKAIRFGRQFSASYRIICASGEVKWVFEKGGPATVPSGEPKTIVGFISDVTQQKLTEQKLQESEGHYRAAMELTGQFPWAADSKGSALELSDELLRNIGLRRRQAVGAGWLNALHPEDVDPTREYWSKAIASQTRIDLRFRALHVSGEYVWYRARGASRTNADGKVVGWHGSWEIIDRQVEAEIKLADAQAELAQLSQASAMNVMAATLAHELNQPLAAASNYLAGSRILVDSQTRRWRNGGLPYGSVLSPLAVHYDRLMGYHL